MADVEMADETPAVQDLSNPDVVNKYREAATIVNTALQGVLTQLAPGKSIADICAFGDSLIESLTAKAFKGKKIEGKGVGFPTCVSVNERVCHYSPVAADSAVLNLGDCVKIDMGAHIDGFIAVAAHTVVLADPAAPITGRRADVIAAAYAAAEAALRVIKPGVKNSAVTDVIRTVADAFGVTPLQGVLMHELKQWVIDGPKVIMLRGDDPEVKVEEHVFEPNEVYTIDIALSTGEGKPREAEARTTVYKRSVEHAYNLKMKASRALVAEVTRRFQTMPFTVRAVEGEESAVRMGLVEATKHGVLVPYPVLVEKEGSEVAHVKFTALLLPGGTLKVSGLTMPANIATDKVLPPAVVELLSQPSYQSKKDKKKGKAAAAATASDEVEMKDA